MLTVSWRTSTHGMVFGLSPPIYPPPASLTTLFDHQVQKQKGERPKSEASTAMVTRIKHFHTFTLHISRPDMDFVMLMVKLGRR